jgi:hypothetical protein
MPIHQIDFRYAPKSVWTCIGRPDDPYKSLVREDGALLYDFDHSIAHAWRFNRVFAFGILTDQQPLSVNQRTESARVPVVITEIRYPKATLTLRAFGHQHDGNRRTDIVLWEIAAATGVRDFLTGLWITAYAPLHYFAPATMAPSQRIFQGRADQRPAEDFWAFMSQEHVEPADLTPPGPLAFLSDPHPLRATDAPGYDARSGLSTLPALVHEGEPRHGALFFPQNHTEITHFDEAWAEAALERERDCWQRLPLQPLTLQTGDPEVNALLEASARNILQAREIEEGLPVFKVGPTIYRSLFVVDGHFFLEAAQYLGYAADAARALETLLCRAHPDGSINIIPDHLKETGIALATLTRQSELSGNWPWLLEHWPIVQRAVAYIRAMREAAQTLPNDDPCHGLLPAGYCDGGLGGKRPEYSTVLWTLFGLKEIAKAAHQLGLAEDAQAFAADYIGLQQAFQEHATEHMGTLPNGTPYLPLRIPGGSSEHHWIADYASTPQPWARVNPGTATWALAQAIYPGELFPPDDLMVQNFCRLLDTIDDEEGIPAETGWLPYRAKWSYAASFYAHAWLYAGRPDKAIDYLYAFANHAAPTRVWREEQSLQGTHHGQYFGDMPHNWASVEFIRLVRNLLVFERGDALELLRGLPAQWLQSDLPVIVEATPTRFGPVSLDLRCTAERQVTITVKLASHWSQQPAQVQLYLPATCDVSTIRLNGDKVAGADINVVVLPHLPANRIDFRLT